MELPTARPKDPPEALHHIVCRGIGRHSIFRNQEDRKDFLERVSRISKETKTFCHGWALMPKRAYLLLQSEGIPIAVVMHRLLTGYALSFNRRHKRKGPLFRAGYESLPLQGPHPDSPGTASGPPQVSQTQKISPILRKAAAIFKVPVKAITSGGKQPNHVNARSLAAFWAVRELGMKGHAVGRKIGLSQSAVSRAVLRGELLSEKYSPIYQEEKLDNIHMSKTG
jgi:hypothetical protein